MTVLTTFIHCLLLYELLIKSLPVVLQTLKLHILMSNASWFSTATYGVNFTCSAYIITYQASTQGECITFD